jgi:nitroreductase
MQPDTTAHRTITIDGKPRYYEPAPERIDLDAFRAVVESRRSVRKFTKKPIPREVLDACLDLAMLAPNSSGLQSWSFHVVRTPALKEQLVKACMGQLAAKTASELIVCTARTDRVRVFAKKMQDEWPLPDMPPLMRRYYQLIPFNYTPGPFSLFGLLRMLAVAAGGLFTPLPRGPYTHEQVKTWATKTAALACENLVLALRAHGFDTCMMEGFDSRRVSKLLKLRSGEFPIMVIGAGERADDGVFWPRIRFDRKLFVFEH